jgi:hypothetical protein
LCTLKEKNKSEEKKRISLEFSLAQDIENCQANDIRKREPLQGEGKKIPRSRWHPTSCQTKLFRD